MKKVNEAVTRFEVQMKLRWYNRNLFGTHFGGSLYAMCDPFFVFIVFANLGKDYIVWDKAAGIKFKRPGKGTMTAIFEISQDKLQEIKEKVDLEGKATFHFQTAVKDPSGEVVAEVDKEIYVRKKNRD